MVGGVDHELIMVHQDAHDTTTTFIDTFRRNPEFLDGSYTSYLLRYFMN